MIRSVLSCLGLVIAAMMIAGCQSMTYDISPSMGTISGRPAAPSVGSVEKSVKAHYLFWGLMPVIRPDINQIAAQSAGANRILGDISIKEENTFFDGLLALVTYGIYRPRTIEISGRLYNKEGLNNAK